MSEGIVRYTKSGGYVKQYPKCFYTKCRWNMGQRHIEGYKYLDNTCYHNADTNEYVKCTKKEAT